jgi:hypothetical protein
LELLERGGIHRDVGAVAPAGGDEKSVQVSRTDAPAPKTVTGPLHTPPTNVINVGVLVPRARVGSENGVAC